MQTICLPLPHSWFEAETTLPRRRYKPERHRSAALRPLDFVLARLTVFRDGEVGQATSDNVLDRSQRSFDDYFSIVRSNGAPADLLRTAMAKTLAEAACDVTRGTSLTLGQMQTIARGLHRIADWLQAPTDIPDEVSPAPAQEFGTVDAIFRWKTQHHTFFLLVHAMLYLLHVLEEALDREHSPVVASILSDFTDLMQAAAETFRLAADFPTEDYNALVRPDMVAHDPHFSGLFYSDHKELITSLRVLRRVPADFAEEMAELQDAVTNMYNLHALVCERFVGLSASLANRNPEKVGPDNLRGKYLTRTKATAGWQMES